MAQNIPYTEDEEFIILEVVLDHPGSIFSKARKLSEQLNRPYYGVLRKIYRTINNMKADGLKLEKINEVKNQTASRGKHSPKEYYFSLLEGKEFFSEEWGDRNLQVKDSVIFDKDSKEVIGDLKDKSPNSKKHISTSELKELIGEYEEQTGETLLQ